MVLAAILAIGLLVAGMPPPQAARAPREPMIGTEAVPHGPHEVDLSLENTADIAAEGQAQPTALRPPRSLLDSPEFVDVVVDQVHAAHKSNKTKAWLRVCVSPFATGLAQLLDKHLKKEYRDALRNARLTKKQWADLGKLLSGFQDPEAQKLGIELLMSVREKGRGKPESAHLRLKELVKEKLAQIAILQDRLMPHSIQGMASDYYQRHYTREGSAGDGPSLWRGMLETRVLALLRGNATVGPETPKWGAASIPSRRLLEHGFEDVDGLQEDFRRLQEDFSRHLANIDIGVAVQSDAWANPALNGAEFGISLASVIMLLGFEVVLHLEFFMTNFYMPWWGWLLIIVPVEGMSVTTCIFGFSTYCKIIAGALGVHLVEGTMGLIYFQR